MNRTLAIPTVNAVGFAFIMGVMFYVGMAQGNGVAYLLFFMLLGVLLVSVPRSLLNLRGLEIKVESPKPVFAGQELSLPVELVNRSNRVRYALYAGLTDKDQTSELVDEIPAGMAARSIIRYPATRRGKHEITALTVASIYPLGFLRAWRNIAVSQTVLVYPEPVGDPNLPLPSAGKESAAQAIQPEGDDFAGHRPYQLGEAQRHIDWKAVARGNPLMSKQFATEQGGALELNFEAIEYPGLEERLSQLALWVIVAERSRRPYRLILPRVHIPAGTGEAHYHECLKALACYQ